jgi:hypothetical protein
VPITPIATPRIMPLLKQGVLKSSKNLMKPANSFSKIKGGSRMRGLDKDVVSVLIGYLGSDRMDIRHLYYCCYCWNCSAELGEKMFHLS